MRSSLSHSIWLIHSKAIMLGVCRHEEKNLAEGSSTVDHDVAQKSFELNE